MIKLGVNIDHVATLRQARKENFPSPLQAASICEKAGADSITTHLREDRRHIQDKDVFDIKNTLRTKLNFEMAACEEIINIALKLQPYSVCIVPEKRQEVTTEGGLDVVSQKEYLKTVVGKLKEKDIIVTQTKVLDEIEKIKQASICAVENNLIVNAGHGLDYQNVSNISALGYFNEFNIGFAIIAQALFDGLETAVVSMKKIINKSL